MRAGAPHYGVILVAEHGSFSKAALVLGVAPALSRQVRALEG